TEQARVLRWAAESLGVEALPEGTQRTRSQPSFGAPAPSAPAPLDIKSFYAKKDPKSDVQFATLVAYFYRYQAPEKDRLETITSDVLQNAGRQARGFGFKAPSVTLNNAVAQGYLDRAGRGFFKINAVGENLVAMALPGAGADGASGGGAPVRKRKVFRKKA